MDPTQLLNSVWGFFHEQTVWKLVTLALVAGIAVNRLLRPKL